MSYGRREARIKVSPFQGETSSFSGSFVHCEVLVAVKAACWQLLFTTSLPFDKLDTLISSLVLSGIIS